MCLRSLGGRQATHKEKDEVGSRSESESTHEDTLVVLDQNGIKVKQDHMRSKGRWLERLLSRPAGSAD